MKTMHMLTSPTRPDTCDYMGNYIDMPYTPCWARCKKQQKPSLIIWLTQWKWNNRPHPCRIVSAIRMKHEQPPENTSLGLILAFHKWDLISIIKFNH